MSYLFQALSGAAVPLISRAASWIVNKAAPYVRKAAGWLGNLINGQSGRNFANSAIDYFVDKAHSVSWDGIKRFANNDIIRRKIPVQVQVGKDKGQVYRDRLRDGYSEIVNGIKAHSGPGPAKKEPDVPMKLPEEFRY